MKLTDRRLKALIKDEHMAHREYTSLGLLNLAADEKRHELFLRKIQIERKMK